MKLIIDIDKDVYDDIEHNKGEYINTLNWAVRNGIPYKERPQGDLISRSELRKCAIPCVIHNGALTDMCVPLYQIDNAPTVEPRIEYGTDGQPYRLFMSSGQVVPDATVGGTKNEVSI